MTDYTAAFDGKGHQFQIDDARRIADSLRTEATIANGVIRWVSNGQVPPADCVALAAHIGLPVDVPACAAARDADIGRVLAAYRRSPRRDDAEAAFERRAAFGTGANVVDVVSGHRYRT